MAGEPPVLLDIDNFLDEGVPIINEGIKKAHEAIDNAHEAVKISKEPITFSKTTFSKFGKNLFDKSTAIKGYYVNYTNGQLVPEIPQYPVYASDYIEIKPNVDYPISVNGVLSTTQHAYYDQDKKFIVGFNSNKSKSPSNAKYVRITIDAKDLDLKQIEEGPTATAYETFNVTIKELNIKENNIPNGVIGKEKINFQIPEMTPGKNLFDKSKATYGYYVDHTTGLLRPHSSPYLFYASDYIAVEPNTTCTRPDAEPLAFYNESKVFISGGRLSNPVTTPANAKYVRLSIPASQIDTYQFEQGNIKTAYESYGYYLEKLLSPKDEKEPSINIVLPSKMYIAVGRTMEIYNSQVIDSNRKDIHVVYQCSVGKQLKRKWQIAATSPIKGTYTLTIKVYDSDMNLLTSKNLTIEIVEKTLSATKLGLCIGDSLTDIDVWRKEVKTLADAMFGTGKLEYIGTKGTAPYKHEGMSGWKTGDFLTNKDYTYGGNIILTVNSITTPPQSKKRYTVPDDAGGHVWEVEKLEGNKLYMNRITNGTYKINVSGTITQVDGTTPGDASITYSSWAWQPGNPFWNTTTNQLDFNDYLTRNNFQQPDFVTIFLGANNLSATSGNRANLKKRLQTAAADMKAIVDKIRSQWSTTKVFVVLIPFWADQNGLGRNYTSMDINNKRGMDLRVFLYNQLLIDTFASYDANVQIVGVGQTMDSENVYILKDCPVNPRSSIMEKQSTGGVHPDNTGFLQMADTIFSSLAGVI
ncbi:SGNH/GDSL hydrolase family protein [Bacillus cereus]|uniref:SGNH/GDSL hydrolase family protein n=1 Tax=Bacillus cereus TaxID=1396 RepID=UPI002112EC2C|nr:SGNH/GDSL hydrolase family protein [Bacillus cereus]